MNDTKVPAAAWYIVRSLCREPWIACAVMAGNTLWIGVDDPPAGMTSFDQSVAILDAVNEQRRTYIFGFEIRREPTRDLLAMRLDGAHWLHRRADRFP